ncbi:MAG: hypothetical protein IJG07_11575 [Prevotella sp.]|nr:hypothetical protein [Prevotella sp.]
MYEDYEFYHTDEYSAEFEIIDECYRRLRMPKRWVTTETKPRYYDRDGYRYYFN